jgi:hypothetical protein
MGDSLDSAVAQALARTQTAAAQLAEAQLSALCFSSNSSSAEEYVDAVVRVVETTQVPLPGVSPHYSHHQFPLSHSVNSQFQEDEELNYWTAVRCAGVAELICVAEGRRRPEIDAGSATRLLSSGGNTGDARLAGNLGAYELEDEQQSQEDAAFLMPSLVARRAGRLFGILARLRASPDPEQGGASSVFLTLERLLARVVALAVSLSSPPLWAGQARWLAAGAMDGSVDPDIAAEMPETTTAVDGSNNNSSANANVVQERSVSVIFELFRALRGHEGEPSVDLFSFNRTFEAPAQVQSLLGLPLFSALQSVRRSILFSMRMNPQGTESAVSAVRVLLSAYLALKTAVAHGMIPFRERGSSHSTESGSNDVSEVVEASALLVGDMLAETPADVNLMLMLSHLHPETSGGGGRLLMTCARVAIRLCLHVSERHCVAAAPHVGALLAMLWNLATSMGVPAHMAPLPLPLTLDNERGEPWLNLSAPLEPERERLLAEAISGMHKILDNGAFRCDDAAKRQVPQLLAAYEAIHSLVTQESVPNLVLRLITQYMLTRPRDVEEWEADPEAFVDEEIRGAWEYDMREAAVILLLTLESDFLEFTVPVLVDFASTLDGRPIHEMDAILLALSGAYVAISDLFAPSLLFETVMGEVRQISLRRRAEPVSNRGFRPEFLLERRAGQIAEGWAAAAFEHLDEEGIARLYGMLESLIHSSDYVVALWGAAGLREMLRDAGFDSTQFEPFVVGACQALVRLLQESSETSTNLEVMRVIAMVVKRMRVEFANFVQLFEILWQLHEACKEKPLLLAGIVEVVTTLVRVVDPGVWDPFLLAFIAPLIRESCDPEAVTEASAAGRRTQKSLVMAEDGLSLWVQVLRRSQEHVSSGVGTFGLPLLNLFPLIPKNIDFGSVDPRGWAIENEALVLAVTQQYVKKGGDDFLRSRAADIRAIVTSCTARFSKLSTDGKCAACLLLGYWMQMFPSEIRTLESALTRLFLHLAIATPRARAEGMRRNPMQQRIAGEGDDKVSIVAAHIVAVFSRLLVEDCAFCEELIGAAARESPSPENNGMSAEALLGAFVNVMFSSTRRMMPSNDSTRLCAVGVAMLLGIVHEVVWTRAPFIVECVLHIGDAQERDVDSDIGLSSLFLTDEGSAVDDDLLDLFDQVSLQDPADVAASSTTDTRLRANRIDEVTPRQVLCENVSNLLGRSEDASAFPVHLLGGVATSVGAQFAAQVVRLLPEELSSRIVVKQ